jgi:gamma-glutamyltranspeptidase/glutathione hydrolase
LPGGPKILTVTAQLLVNLIDFGCSARETVTAPRVHAEGGEPIGVSKSLDMKVVGELEAMGHRVERGQTVGGPPDEIAGYANAVVVDDAGKVSAASGASPLASHVI